MQQNQVRSIVYSLQQNIRRVIVGKDEAIELALIALLCKGHVLIEDVPGVGKTTLVAALARSLSCSFKRIQFTPDVTPSDITGFTMPSLQTGEMEYKSGAVMSQIVLADEINRTPPKTQAALLQAMNERSVTIDRQTHPLGEEFMVVATQNPIEQQGTYPLPEAQLDRFLFKVNVPFPSLEELRELARTAGYPVVGTATQKLQSPVAATFMGSGRLLELKEYLEAVEADLIIFDEELSPAQLRNIEELCDCPVLDRTMLILDIFAARAASGEGKLQVELARLQYQLPRLAGRGVQLSRQGGGGTGGTGARRGAGESKLEVDRRHIRRRIDALKTELAALARRREQRRTRRKKDGVTTVAIVGYTNVGKSTLLNTLTQAGVLAEDKLFATLDPTARALELPDGRKVMLIDTVGLVRRLPHQLVEAFHSTLEEAASADLILSVCDITSPELLEQRAVTERLLEELGVEGTPVITVLNKCDAAPDAQNEPYKGCVRISAKTGYGLPRLLQTIAETLPPQRLRCRLCLPYAEGALLHRLEEQGQIFSREYTAEGTLLDAEVEQRDWRLYETYLRTED